MSIGTLYRRIPAAAQRAGTVRPDVTVQDIFLIFWSNANIIRATHAVARGAWRRSLALEGLRTEAAHPLPRGRTPGNPHPPDALTPSRDAGTSHATNTATVPTVPNTARTTGSAHADRRAGSHAAAGPPGRWESAAQDHQPARPKPPFNAD